MTTASCGDAASQYIIDTFFCCRIPTTTKTAARKLVSKEGAVFKHASQFEKQTLTKSHPVRS